MREQLLAAKNLVMGTTNILLITLPDSWRVVDGHSAPEVERWTEQLGRRWMSRGRAPYRLVEPHPGQPGLVRAEVELMITAFPEGGAPSEAQGMACAIMAEAEHELHYAYGSARRGLLRRVEVPALTVVLTCSETERHLRLELTAGARGGAPTAARGDLERLLAAMAAGMRCH